MIARTGKLLQHWRPVQPRHRRPIPEADSPKYQFVVVSKAVLAPQRVVPAGPRVCTRFRHAAEPVADATPVESSCRM